MREIKVGKENWFISSDSKDVLLVRYEGVTVKEMIELTMDEAADLVVALDGAVLGY